MNEGYQPNNKTIPTNAVQRSGLQSDESPFGNLKTYYRDGGSPVRQSMANNKHIGTGQNTWNQMTG